MTNKNNYVTVNVSDPFKMIDNLWNGTWGTTAASYMSTDPYPPHNVIELDEDTRVVEFAVAGFDKSEISVKQDNYKVIVSGEKSKKENEPKYLHKGIAQRKFQKEYALWEYWNVKSVDLNNGILYVVIKREVPEEKKPKVFEIQ